MFIFDFWCQCFKAETNYEFYRNKIYLDLHTNGKTSLQIIFSLEMLRCFIDFLFKMTFQTIKFNLMMKNFHIDYTKHRQ